MAITELQNIQQSDVSSVSVPVVRVAVKMSASDTSFTTNTTLLDETGATISKDCILGIRKANGYVEKIYVPGGSISGVSITGVTRGIPQGGLDFTTGDSGRTTTHEVGEEVFIVNSGQGLQQLLAFGRGEIGSGQRNLKIGDATTNATQGYEIDQGLLSSTTKYGADASGNPLITLPDGSSFIPGAGAGAISGGDGIDVTASVISVDLGVDPCLEFTGAGTDKLEVQVATDEGIEKTASGLQIDRDKVKLNENVVVTATSTEINQALDGISANVTATNLNTLTGEGFADTEHKHDPFTLAQREIETATHVTIKGYNLNNWAEAITGGSVSYNSVNTTLQTGATSGNDCILNTAYDLNLGGLSMTRIDWDHDLFFVGNIETISATNQDLFWGFWDNSLAAVPANATSIVKHVGFFVEDGTLYASVADGTTQEKSDISSGITLTDRNTYRIEFTSATSALFYVNNTLKATLSTNDPTGVTNSNGLHFVLGATTAENAIKGFQIMSNFAIKSEL